MCRTSRIIIFLQLVILTMFGGVVHANQDSRNSEISEKDTARISAAINKEILDSYMIDIARQINEKWLLKAQIIANDKFDPTAVTSVIFIVLPNGKIDEVLVAKESGDHAFDEFVFQTVVEASPVKPHPKELSKPFIHMGLNFSANGLK